MSGFLLDTNVPSEMTRPQPHPRVVEWLNKADDLQLHLSVVSLGEILKGITLLTAGNRRSTLQRWLDETLRPWFAGRILPIDEAVAERWGLLTGECLLRGRQLKVGDGLIAATALQHGLTLVTRNKRDFEDVGVDIVSPWE